MTLQGPQPTCTTPPNKTVTFPADGESITSMATNNTYKIGQKIGEGSFGIVYECFDVWNNDLAVKVMKPKGSYEDVRKSTEAEFGKLRTLRHPFVTYVFDAFECRDTFYIVTERCHGPVNGLFQLADFNGMTWFMPIARCLLQAVYYLHINSYSHQDIHSGNVFTTFVKDELMPSDHSALLFKLGDLGVAKLVTELDFKNTRAEWMLPPEVLDHAEFGPIDHRVDIYHTGLLLLGFAHSRELQFTSDERLRGLPRDMALQLQPPLKLALEKALRRHVQYRTADAMEFWRDLNTHP